MDFLKLDPTAAGLKEIDGEVMVLSNEDGNIAYSQHYAVKTGVAISVPKGQVALLAETQPMGARGVSVCGKLVTCQDMTELRVGLQNLSRTAFPISKGMPLCRIILMDAEVGTLRECKDLDVWTKELKERTSTEAAKLHENTVTNGPGPNPGSKALLDEANTKGHDAKVENATPKGTDVSDANASKNPALNPGGVIKPVPGVLKPSDSPEATKTPATI
jgi:dUTPase